MLRVIGIDFGTSTTYMNVKRYDGNKPLGDRFTYIPVSFNFGESKGSIETLVRENADGTFDCGGSADEVLEGSTVYRGFKMDLESADEEKRSIARRETERFFEYLHDCYMQQAAVLGDRGDQEETLISYPVKWTAETRDFMVNAAKKAGFPNVRGIDEATAAVFTVLCCQMDEINKEGLLAANRPGYMLLVDMGAGTTDLVVCKYSFAGGGQMNLDSLKTEMVACWPVSSSAPTFGGREIDAVLANYVEDFLENALPDAMKPMAASFANVPGGAKAWKEKNVSVSLSAHKPVTTCSYVANFTFGKKIPPIDRKLFEEMIAGGLADYSHLIDSCLYHIAEKDPAFLRTGPDLVILTGGHSAWYFAREIIDGRMPGYLENQALLRVRQNPRRVIRLSNPQATVALGLVYSKLPYQINAIAEAQPVRMRREKTPGSSPETLFRTGMQYERGKGVVQNDRKAAEFFRAAADQGFVPAQAKLGYCCLFGVGVPINLNQGFELSMLAAKQGNVEGMNNVGYCYMHGKGVQKNTGRAIEYYRKAADLGYSVAQWNLGLCYEKGDGVPKDVNTAISYYRKAADQGDEDSRKRIRILEKGSVEIGKSLDDICYGVAVDLTRRFQYDKYLLTEAQQKSFRRYSCVLNDNLSNKMSTLRKSLLQANQVKELCLSLQSGDLAICDRGVYAQSLFGLSKQFIPWKDFVNCSVELRGMSNDVPTIISKHPPIYQLADCVHCNRLAYQYLTELLECVKKSLT